MNSSRRHRCLTIVEVGSLCYQTAAGFAPYSTKGSIGHVAEWLRSGLQIRARRFDSGRGLHPPALAEAASYGGQALRPSKL